MTTSEQTTGQKRILPKIKFLVVKIINNIHAKQFLLKFGAEKRRVVSSNSSDLKFIVTCIS